ncbi:hypothetical protein C9374_008113 [Naegleria lovaniensis]|uniref:Uncharacterized protein n=1 Tax=Naegleria lovaniensis TaxID=51637 RepID=A0AA88GFL8_NAELO|nr:uncharacterized protein C9374_008113 [Naegleria lovaniensis]KAG2378474.1 hypothetical protein C9374_008113 [Naegleria lovaniensis]
MGQHHGASLSCSDCRSSPHRVPNNFLLWGTYMGVFANSYFIDWHRISIPSESMPSVGQIPSSVPKSSFGRIKELASFAFSSHSSVVHYSNETINFDGGVTIASEIESPILSCPIVKIIASGSNILFMDAKKRLFIYSTTMYETQQFKIERFDLGENIRKYGKRITLTTELNNMINTQLVTISGSHNCILFYFQNGSIICLSQHDINWEILLIDYFKEHGREIVLTSDGCVGSCSYILSRKVLLYENPSEDSFTEDYEITAITHMGSLARVEKGELDGQLHNIKMMRCGTCLAIVTHNNKLYFQNLMLLANASIYTIGVDIARHYGSRDFVRVVTPIELPSIIHGQDVLQIACCSRNSIIMTKDYILSLGDLSHHKDNTRRYIDPHTEYCWTITKNKYGVNRLLALGWSVLAYEDYKGFRYDDEFKRALHSLTTKPTALLNYEEVHITTNLCDICVECIS